MKYAKRKIVLIGINLMVVISLSGQSPDNDSLWNKLNYLWNSTTISIVDKLNEVSKYEIKINSYSGISDSTRSFLALSIGRYALKHDELLKALQYEIQSINIIDASSDRSVANQKHKIRCYYLLSVVYDSLHRITDKIKALDSCGAIAIRLNTIDLYALNAMSTEAQYYYDIGDYQRCINITVKYEKLAKDYSTSGGVNEREAGLAYVSDGTHWQANALLALNETAISESILHNKIKEYEETGMKNYLGILYLQLAEVEVSKNNFKQALDYYNQSFQFNKKRHDTIQCKVILNLIGLKIYYWHLHDRDNAMVFYRKALLYSSKNSEQKNMDATESIPEFINIAVIYADKGYYDSALQYIQLAFDQLKPGIDENDLLRSSLSEFIKASKIYYLTDLLNNKGHIILQKFNATKQSKDIDEAIRFYKIADRLFDKIKTEQSEEQSKLFWRSTARELYEDAIEACYKAKNTQNAFYFFEKSRAVLLNDQLNEQQWMNKTDIFRLSEVRKKKIKSENELKNASPSSKQYDSLQSLYFSQNEEMIRLQELVKTENPLYYQNFIDTATINLQNVYGKLSKNNQLFLELFDGDNNIYALFITQSKTILSKINKSDFDSTTKKYITYISNGSELNSHYYEFNKTASHLYELIFGNMPLTDNRIIISLDDQFFPFESLVTNADFQSPDYFLNDHAVSYTYSARFLLNDFSESNSRSNQNFLGFAPVRYTSSLSLPSLKGSDLSLKRIEDYFGTSDDYIFDKASKNNFITQFSKFAVIQLYTHSSDSSANHEPVIFFGDSALFLSELIPENKPSTKLIVLSACETANGQLYRGEGVFSFNRGFAALGVPSSITNLWSVDDQSTYKITELFYKYLAQGLPLDIALQKAKKEFIQTGTKGSSLPYYWAAAILVGKTDPIELHHNFSWSVLLLSVAVCLVFFFTAKYFIARGKAGIAA